jgi:hypothetical protein
MDARRHVAPASDAQTGRNELAFEFGCANAARAASFGSRRHARKRTPAPARMPASAASAQPRGRPVQQHAAAVAGDAVGSDPPGATARERHEGLVDTQALALPSTLAMTPKPQLSCSNAGS